MRWIIGDIHGMLTPLRAVLDEVTRADKAARFYFAGDYVNRGPNSRGVIELLLSLTNAQFIRGNHDDIFDEVINNKSYAEHAADNNPLVAFQWFMEHGLDSTFESYGVDSATLETCRTRPTLEKLQDIVAAVPPSHRQFIRDLPPLIEETDIFVAHAKWDVDEPDAPPTMLQQLKDKRLWRHKLLWGRFSDNEIGRKKAWSRTGFFGHTPVYAYAASQKTGDLRVVPIAGPRIVLIDTGAALSESGRLTAFCADNNTFVQADHFGKIIIV